MTRAARAVAVSLLASAAGGLEACATCRGNSPVVVQPQLGGSVGSSGASTWSTGGVGLDLSAIFCRPPDPATLPQPGPGSPPIGEPTPGTASPPEPTGEGAPGELPPGAVPL